MEKERIRKREWRVDGDMNGWNFDYREYILKELFYSYVIVIIIILGIEVGFVIEIVRNFGSFSVMVFNK